MPDIELVSSSYTNVLLKIRVCVTNCTAFKSRWAEVVFYFLDGAANSRENLLNTVNQFYFRQTSLTISPDIPSPPP